MALFQLKKKKASTLTKNTPVHVPGIELQQCTNCGSPWQGRYCSECGQKRRDPRDFSLKQFFITLIQEFTFFDSKLIRSVRLLVAKPGFLTTEFFASRDKRYMKPLQLFVTVNILYFLLLQVVFHFNTFNSPLSVQHDNLPYSSLIRPMIDSDIVRHHVTFQGYEAKYNSITDNEAKTLVILMIPFFSVLLSLLYVRHKHYHGEHVVFTLHFYAFFMLLCSFGVGIMGVATEILAALMKIRLTASDYDNILTFIPAICCAVYLYFALRRVYHDSWAKAVLRSSALTFSLIYILTVYRFLLFFSTYFSMRKL